MLFQFSDKQCKTKTQRVIATVYPDENIGDALLRMQHKQKHSQLPLHSQLLVFWFGEDFEGTLPSCSKFTFFFTFASFHVSHILQLLSFRSNFTPCFQPLGPHLLLVSDLLRQCTWLCFVVSLFLSHSFSGIPLAVREQCSGVLCSPSKVFVHCGILSQNVGAPYSTWRLESV